MRTGTHAGTPLARWTGALPRSCYLSSRTGSPASVDMASSREPVDAAPNLVTSGEGLAEPSGPGCMSRPAGAWTASPQGRRHDMRNIMQEMAAAGPPFRAKTRCILLAAWEKGARTDDADSPEAASLLEAGEAATLLPRGGGRSVAVCSDTALCHLMRQGCLRGSPSVSLLALSPRRLNRGCAHNTVERSH